MATDCGRRTTVCGRFALVATAALLLAIPARADQWKFDVVRLKDGRSFPGMIVAENSDSVTFRYVSRQPGRPTSVVLTGFTRAEIAAIDRLEPGERQVLEAHLKALDRDGEAESRRMKQAKLEPAAWVRAATRALAYRSDYFILVSDAREPIVRQAAVRLEQVYAAYERYLPARHKSAGPTRLLLFGSVAEYQARQRERGQDVLNPAYYDPARNTIVCATDLPRIDDEVGQIRKQHSQELRELESLEAELRKQYQGALPQAVQARLDKRRKAIRQANQANEAAIEKATRQLFHTLYHEAFHAYLANFVYTHGDGEVPRWLNEGLAQIFETAVVEAGELRAGSPDRERLDHVRAAARTGQLLPLEKLLTSGPRQFLVAHGSDRQVSDRYYLNAWALAYYLTFERRLLGTPALDRYVRELHRGTAPLAAFEELTGAPLDRTQAEWRAYMLRLRADGSTGPLRP